jgi:hypothetical protein
MSLNWQQKTGIYRIAAGWISNPDCIGMCTAVRWALRDLGDVHMDTMFFIRDYERLFRKEPVCYAWPHPKAGFLKGLYAYKTARGRNQRFAILMRLSKWCERKAKRAK